ncbi:hypothetical protein BLA29_001342 [Euroglyphus maynei]|uniref:MAM domain-containing protein n=1 Tax=Euroglyphus maynei TaxID=6958 RepID=A0A1Y3BF85_EURMA|nr:hypothetical protein BLA29_001342 [Euroglyphus maynei]
MITLKSTSINGQYQQPRLYAADNIVSKCEFINNSCRFRNQHNLAKYNRYAKYRDGCLFVSYRYNGPGTLRFFIIQQDTDNRCIFSDDRTSKTSISNSKENVWNNLELQLDLSEGDVRFFLETHFNSSAKAGYFAIGDFNFGYGYCRNRNENHCYDNFINKHINVAPTAN